MTLVERKSCPIHKSQAFEAPTGLSSNRFDNKNHKDFLKSNKPRSLKALTRPRQTLLLLFSPKDPSAN